MAVLSTYLSIYLSVVFFGVPLGAMDGNRNPCMEAKCKEEREREGERGARQREAARVLKLRIPGAPDQTAMAMPRRTGEHL